MAGLAAALGESCWSRAGAPHPFSTCSHELAPLTPLLCSACPLSTKTGFQEGFFSFAILDEKDGQFRFAAPACAGRACAGRGPEGPHASFCLVLRVLRATARWACACLQLGAGGREARSVAHSSPQPSISLCSKELLEVKVGRFKLSMAEVRGMSGVCVRSARSVLMGQHGKAARAVTWNGLTLWLIMIPTHVRTYLLPKYSFCLPAPCRTPRANSKACVLAALRLGCQHQWWSVMRFLQRGAALLLKPRLHTQQRYKRYLPDQ